jgi:predicted membrane GTPase involved in stress response
VTPLNVRLRKTVLDQTARIKAARARKRADA